jgi:surfeit locus 1 family protein
MTSGKPTPWRRLIAPGITAFIVFWLLIAMGVWQLHRLTWKEGIIASIRQAQAAAPIALPANPSPFEKVIVTGEWVPGKAALYGDQVHDSPNGPVPGAELIMPMQRPDGSVVLVDLGWVPKAAPVPLANPPEAAVGYIHAPIRADWLSPPDDPAAGLYYTLDPQRIGAGLGLSDVAPYILISLGPLPPPGSKMPQPEQDLPTPPNNHYEYALTWFGFAGVLVFQFIFFARKRLAEP